MVLIDRMWHRFVGTIILTTLLSLYDKMKGSSGKCKVYCKYRLGEIKANYYMNNGTKSNNRLGELKPYTIWKMVLRVIIDWEK